MPSVRFPAPRLPIDVRMAARYIYGEEATGARRITVGEDLVVGQWTSDDWAAWTLIDVEGVATWGADGTLEIEFR